MAERNILKLRLNAPHGSLKLRVPQESQFRAGDRRASGVPDTPLPAGCPD